MINPKPPIRDIVWAELLFSPTVKRRVRNSEIIAELLANGWIAHTDRQLEFSLTDLGRAVAEKRMAIAWPTWRQDITEFEEQGLNPEDDGAWVQLCRKVSNLRMRPLKQMNRRTRNAWLRRHSKVAATVLPPAFDGFEFTTDELTRIIFPPDTSFFNNSGDVVNLHIIQEVLGEICIPERAWAQISKIIAPRAKIIFTIENKGAFVDFPRHPSAIIAHLPGDDLTSFEKLTARLPKLPVYHFGDLDPDGMDIFCRLNLKYGVQHLIPPYAAEYVSTHAYEPSRRWPANVCSSVHPVVSQLMTFGKGLEQEALVLDARFEDIVDHLVKHHDGPSANS